MTTLRVAGGAAGALNRLASWIVRSPALEALVFSGVAVIYFYNAFTFSLPPGYAGLYSLMIEEVAKRPFPMPTEIPFYGPGGVPFVYPPLGAYFLAPLVDSTGALSLEVVRWMPPFTTLCALAALYVFARRLFGDRLAALVGLVFVACSEIIYEYHATASGIVRSQALLWAVLGAYLALRAFEDRLGRKALVALAGVFLGFTMMTHLAYAAFLVLGIVLMAVHGIRRAGLLPSITNLGLILLVGLIVAAPWWATVLGRHGATVLLNAGGTHGTLDFFTGARGSPGTMLGQLARFYIYLGQGWWPAMLGVLTTVALAYAIATGAWLLPAWILLTIMFLGETDRFVVVLGGLLIGVVLVDISRAARMPRPLQTSLGPERLGGLLFLGLVMIPTLALGFRGIQWTSVVLAGDLVETASWMRSSTGEDDRYLYLGDDHDVGEWLPYLSHRTPAVAPWGAEWTGDYQRQGDLMAEIGECAREQEFSCVEGVINKIGSQVSLLVVPDGRDQLRASIAESAGWAEIYRNPGYVLFEATQ